MTRTSQPRYIIILMLDSVPSGHLHYNRLIGHELDWKLTLGLIHALTPAARIGKPVGRFVNIEHRMYVVPYEIVIRIENVIIIPVGGDQVLRYHVVALLEVVDVVARFAGGEASRQQDFSIVTDE